MIKLQTNIKSFSCAIHIADIHIRLQKRHDEYQQVFGNFYSLIDKSPSDTFVCVVGDLLHSKTDLQPECIQLASNFLKNVADKRPTILVAGNHDALLTNKDRLDSLSPIVNALNHPNISYLKDSGLYILGDVLFNNMSVFDDYDKYMKAKDIPTIYRNQTRHLISLYHGTIDQASTDVGHIMNNKQITAETFRGHDISMCGDIHRMQSVYIEKETLPVIHYAGSLCQQDHGESLENHGCSLWNLKERKYVHIDIPNDYGFFTIHINKGKLVTDITNIPKKARLRVMCLESVATEVKAVLSEIKKSSEIVESVYIRLANEEQLKSSIESATTLNLSDLSSVDYQNKLIKDYLDKKFTDDKINFDKIYEINKELNSKLEQDNLARNIRWKPKKLEFSNMFSYGENNVIDFTNMSGLIGVFAANASGKSSILDILSFCLYDKCSKSFRASHILNSQKMSFTCKFNFEISGIDYFVERSGTADKKGNVKVDVKFWKTVAGKDVELHGEARRSTNDIIRDFVGSYDDFILTTLSIQNNKSGTFIDMGQTERKDLLSQFMGLNVFDLLFSAASDKLKEINVLLKNYTMSTDKNPDELIQEYTTKIALLTTKINSKTSDGESLHNNRNLINSDIITKTKEYIKLEKDVPTDINLLEVEKTKLEKDIDVTKIKIADEKSANVTNEANLLQLEADIKELTDKNVTNLYQEYLTYVDNFDNEEVNLDKQRIIIKAKLDKLDKLKNHKYDPNCKFCVDNEFVKDAMAAKETLDNDKIIVDGLLTTHSKTKEKIDALKYVVDLNSNYLKLDKKKTAVEKEISTKTSTILRLESALAKTTGKLIEVVNKIEVYHKQKESIEHNKNIDSEIDKLNVKLKEFDKQIKTLNNELLKLNSDLTIATETKSKLESELIKTRGLEVDQKAYEYYVSAVSRDGIPFELITQAMPIIEKEVNEILHQVVEFGVNIQTDGKNVMAYIVRDDKKWPLELASGMEKFLTGLALRVALINVSNLPKSNFIAVDEGFGTLDMENLSALSSLFSILKNHFEFVMIISHLESLRDLVNVRLEISKNDGFSKVNYN